MSTLYGELLVNGRRPRDSFQGVHYLRGSGGLTEQDLAKVTQAAWRVCRQRAEPEAALHPSNDELREIVTELADSLTARGISRWLRAPNGYLQGEPPIALLVGDEFERVRAAAVAFGEGIYI